MISFLLIFFAAMFNAIMDKIENEIQFNTSAFKNLDKNFWCKEFSASAKFIPFTRYRPDAWHISKSLMIICISLAVVFYKPVFYRLDFVDLGITWILSFNVFYNRVFKK